MEKTSDIQRIKFKDLSLFELFRISWNKGVTMMKITDKDAIDVYGTKWTMTGSDDVLAFERVYYHDAAATYEI
jgi:hypothetical protein